MSEDQIRQMATRVIEDQGAQLHEVSYILKHVKAITKRKNVDFNNIPMGMDPVSAVRNYRAVAFWENLISALNEKYRIIYVAAGNNNKPA